MDIVYDAIKKIPGITDNEAHEVATKLRSRDDLATKKDLAELETRIIKQMYGVAVLIVVLVVGLIKYL